ncbi:uncharacterized protein LOC117307414 [Asterias rubens]|uniref:uncharacterized protein LOC117307414 n=1 Tax=Asterias rubens TaxID=7604 RepID=UPI001454F1D2|nr:uncharacterized protein LOC117307414 [Asterias rubens]
MEEKTWENAGLLPVVELQWHLPKKQATSPNYAFKPILHYQTAQASLQNKSTTSSSPASLLPASGDDGTLAHTVHRKPTHTDRYLHNSSFHHLRFKSAVCNTLACRAFNTCEKGSLKQELHHIKTSPQLDRYKTFNLSKPKTSLNPDERPEFKGCNHPPIGHTSHNLQRIFSQAQVKTFHRAPSKIQVSLHTHKEKQDTQDRAGVYHIPCDCGIVHIGETGHNISTRVKKWPTMLIR